MGELTNKCLELLGSGNNFEEYRSTGILMKSINKKPMKIYLAIPYTFNPERSFQIANKISAGLMSKGHVVFSPISHSHPIADHLPDELRTNSDWWMTQDLPMVDWADEVHVVCIGEYGCNLIEDSKGVQMELEHAKLTRKPIKIIEFYE